MSLANLSLSRVSVSVECKAQAGEESCRVWRIIRSVFNRRSSRITGNVTHTHTHTHTHTITG